MVSPRLCARCCNDFSQTFCYYIAVFQGHSYGGMLECTAIVTVTGLRSKHPSGSPNTVTLPFVAKLAFLFHGYSAWSQRVENVCFSSSVNANPAPLLTTTLLLSLTHPQFFQLTLLPWPTATTVVTSVWGTFLLNYLIICQSQSEPKDYNFLLSKAWIKSSLEKGRV